MKLLKRGKLLGRVLSRNNSDRGFATPMAVGFGLIIIMIAGAMMIRSQNDSTTAALQQATGSSLNVTEGGITRIQTFINTHRPMATYSLAEWLGAPLRMTNITPCSPTTPSQIVAFATAAREWQNVDPNDPTKGQFRLVNYTYRPNDPTQPYQAPGTGILEVEGRLANQGSISRLQVEIPILQGDVIGVPIPGVWITNGGTGGNRIQGNVLMNDCTASPGNTRVTGADGTTGDPYEAKYTSMQLPALPPRPSPFLNTLPANISSNVVLPRTGDRAITRQLSDGQTVQIYEYRVDELRIAQNSNLTIMPGQRVTFYLNGSISRGGDIRHNCTTAPSGVSCAPTDFQVFGYGPVGSSICLNGTNYLDMFVLAPNYTFGVAGSGGGQGGLRGAVWVRDWSTGGGCGSNTSNITAVQSANWDMLGLVPQNLPPKVAPIRQWEREEVTLEGVN